MDSVDNPAVRLSREVVKPPNGAVVRSDRESRVDADAVQETLPATDGELSGGADQPLSGRDLAHAALAAARAKAQARGAEPGVRKRAKATDFAQNSRRRRWSGAGADSRDPQPLGRLVSRLSAERGWAPRLANGQVFGQWARLVGEEVAEHAQPVSLKDGELTVQTSSTAWATQLRLLQGQLLTKIAAAVGHGVVKRMRIHGPTAPSWRKGARFVPGRGPRDTYG